MSEPDFVMNVGLIVHVEYVSSSRFIIRFTRDLPDARFILTAHVT